MVNSGYFRFGCATINKPLLALVNNRLKLKYMINRMETLEFLILNSTRLHSNEPPPMLRLKNPQ